MLLTVFGLILLGLLAVPSAIVIGAIMTVLGGAIVGPAAPGWWRLVVGFGAIMAAGAVTSALGLGASEGAYDALRR